MTTSGRLRFLPGGALLGAWAAGSSAVGAAWRVYARLWLRSWRPPVLRSLGFWSGSPGTPN